MKYFILIPVLTLLWSCLSTADTDTKEKSRNMDVKEVEPSTQDEQQLNISILWDLSDRIDSLANPAAPQHYKRDIEVIKKITAIFKKDMEKRGAYKAKGKIKVIFIPTPYNEKINTIAGQLSCDLASFTGDGANRKKKEIYDSLETRFERNATKICHLTFEDNKGKKKWDGADIWRFFKNNAKDYCVDPAPGYRNILVLLTDGYIYHKDSKEKLKNKTTFILPELFKPFRNNPNWQTSFNDGGYGLISTRNDLKNLEVLVLEINPSKVYKNDEDIIKMYLGKWFEAMGILQSNYACFNSELPEYTGKNIETFFKRKK